MFEPVPVFHVGSCMHRLVKADALVYTVATANSHGPWAKANTQQSFFCKMHTYRLGPVPTLDVQITTLPVYPWYCRHGITWLRKIQLGNLGFKSSFTSFTQSQPQRPYKNIIGQVCNVAIGLTYSTTPGYVTRKHPRKHANTFIWPNFEKQQCNCNLSSPIFWVG